VLCWVAIDIQCNIWLLKQSFNLISESDWSCYYSWLFRTRWWILPHFCFSALQLSKWKYRHTCSGSFQSRSKAPAAAMEKYCTCD